MVESSEYTYKILNDEAQSYLVVHQLNDDSHMLGLVLRDDKVIGDLDSDYNSALQSMPVDQAEGEPKMLSLASFPKGEAWLTPYSSNLKKQIGHYSSIVQDSWSNADDIAFAQAHLDGLLEYKRKLEAPKTIQEIKPINIPWEERRGRDDQMPGTRSR